MQALGIARALVSALAVLSLGGKPVGKSRFCRANDPRRNAGLAPRH